MRDYAQPRERCTKISRTPNSAAVFATSIFNHENNRVYNTLPGSYPDGLFHNLAHRDRDPRLRSGQIQRPGRAARASCAGASRARDYGPKRAASPSAEQRNNAEPVKVMRISGLRPGSGASLETHQRCEECSCRIGFSPNPDRSVADAPVRTCELAGFAAAGNCFVTVAEWGNNSLVRILV
jgi:hypothetical protein